MDPEELFHNDPAPEVANPIRLRECDLCHTSYAFKKQNSRFCSSKCKDTFNNSRRGAKPVGNPEAPAAAPAPAAPPAASKKSSADWQKDLQIHVKIAMDLLERDRDAWQERCKKLEKEVDELEVELAELEEQSTLKDHQLSGLQDAQPNSFQKFMAAIPAELMTEVAPRIGSAMDWLLNGAQKGLSGAAAQIDPAVQKQLEGFITWFAALQPEMQTKVLQTVTLLSRKEGQDLDNILTRLNSLLNYDNPLKTHQQYYGGFNAGAFASPTGT